MKHSITLCGIVCHNFCILTGIYIVGKERTLTSGGASESLTAREQSDGLKYSFQCAIELPPNWNQETVYIKHADSGLLGWPRQDMVQSH